MKKIVVAFDQAHVGEAEVGVVPDNDMIQDSELHDIGSEDKFPGDFPVAFRRLRISGRMIVYKNQRRGSVSQSSFYNLSRINDTRIHGSFKKSLFFQNMVFRIQEDDLKLLLS